MAIACLAAAACVWTRDGNLGYDDSQYVRNAIVVARNALDSHSAIRTFASGLLSSKPKPPLYIAWLAAGAMILPDLPNAALLIWATVPIFLATMSAIYGVSTHLQGPRAGAIALLVYGGSSCAMSFACQLWVETMLSLCVLVALHALAVLSTNPGLRTAAAAGIVTGLGMLTKLSCAAFLLPPAAVVAVWLFLTQPWRKAWVIAITYGGCLLLVALPWYIRNWQPALAYASWCADFPRMLGYQGILTPSFRLKSFIGELLGLGSLVALATAFLWGAHSASSSKSIAPRFMLLFALAFVPAVVVEFGGRFYEARHLLPIVPAYAVVVGLVVDARLRGMSRPTVRWCCWLALTAGVAASIFVVAHERTAITDWRWIGILDEARGSRKQVDCAVIGGDCACNVQKLELFDALSGKPRYRFTDFSTSAFLQPQWEERLKACDQVLVVEERDRHVQQLAPGLNDAVTRALEVAAAAGFVPCQEPWALKCDGVRFLVRPPDR